MTGRARTNSGERLLILAALAVLVGGSAYDFYAFSAQGTARVTTTEVPSTALAEGPLVFASPVSAQGLQLEVTLNSSSIRRLGTIGAQIDLLTASDNVTLPVPGFSEQEPVEVWNGYDYVCGENPSNSVLAFAVFPGDFSSANISSAGQPLSVGAPFFPPCPNGGLYPPGHSITFPSKGVNARLNVTNGYCAPSPGLQNGDCGVFRGLDGYYNRTAGYGFVNFPPGEYTIAATDLWNQYVYATFIVQSEPSSTLALESSSSQSVSRSECAASPAPKGNSSFAVTETLNGWPSCDCALVASNSYAMLYVSTDATVGDLVCLAASLNGSDTVAFTITNSTGSVVLQTLGCVSTGGLGGSPSTGISCETDWDTAAPGESGGAVTVGAGAVTAGTYTLAATDGPGSPAVLEANFTLG